MRFTICLLLLCIHQSVLANAGDFFVKPVFGISSLSDTLGQSVGLGQTNGDISVNVDSGMNAGIGFGYYYSDAFAVELFWEYRSNDSETILADGSMYSEGNYASNIFYLNGMYFFQTDTNWQYYVGAGVGWVQEIDIDLERDGNELSFSGSGEAALQAFAGLNYKFNEQISIDLEFRKSFVDSATLDGEQNNGVIRDLDYDPATFQLGLTYRF